MSTARRLRSPTLSGRGGQDGGGGIPEPPGGATLDGATPSVLLSAEQASGPAYRVGFNNFYVISRYNRSARYAMAVDDLAHVLAPVRNSKCAADAMPVTSSRSVPL